jgi:bacillithiol system protein YtxJ
MKTKYTEMKTKYTEMHAISDWDSYWFETINTPILVLKHSTACPISSAALGEFSIFSRNPKRKIICLMIKVIQSRAVSNYIEETTLVTHQSPQILLIRNKEVLWQESHWGITFERIEQEVNSRVAIKS